MDTTLINRYVDRAKAALAAGFRTKSAQANAKSDVSSAFSEAARYLPSETGTGEWLDLPYSPAHWRAKHRDLVLSVNESHVAALDLIDQLVDLYKTIAAAPVVKVTAEERRVAALRGKKTRIQLRGHCQSCGRLQASTLGNVAKHGYEVKDRGNWGYFTGICSGQHYAPMEVSRDHADYMIGFARAQADHHDAQADALRSGKIKPATVRGPWDSAINAYRTIPFDEAPSWTRRDAVKSAIWQEESKASGARQWAGQMESLVNKVHGKALIEVEVAA